MNIETLKIILMHEKESLIRFKSSNLCSEPDKDYVEIEIMSLNHVLELMDLGLED